MPSTVVISHSQFWSWIEVDAVSIGAPAGYAHSVLSILECDFRSFGAPLETPMIDVKASFFARNKGGTDELPCFITLHAGGSSGFPRPGTNFPFAPGDLIGPLSGAEVFSEEIAWTAGAGTYSQHSVEAQMANPGGIQTLRFGLRCSVDQRLDRAQLFLTLSAAEA